MNHTTITPDPEKETIWRRRVAQQAASGLTVRDWRRQAGCSASPFYYWKSTLAKRDGVELSRTLLCQWAMMSAEVLEPVVKAMTKQVLRSHVVATDDTPVDVQTRGAEGPGNHQGRLWIYIGGGLRPYTVYDFSWTRGGEHPEKFLGDFSGILLADAYSGYDRLFKGADAPTEAGCNAHARRYFFEALAEHPALAQRVLRLYKKLYAVEREAKEQWPALREPAPDPHELAAAAAGLLELRRRRSKPVMKAMIEIKPNCLYSRADLAAMLEPAGVDVDHFIGRLRSRKVFKMLWLGADILKAFEAAPALAERPDAPELPPAANRGNRGRRGPARADRPGALLEAYRRTLKGERL